MNGRLERNNMGIEVKTGRVDQACARYGVGRNTMRQIASQAGAVVRIGKNYLISQKLIGIWTLWREKNEMIDRIAANGWKVPKDIKPQEYVPGINS